MRGAGESVRPLPTPARNRSEDRVALRIYLDTQRSGARPGVAAIVAALKCCGSAKDLHNGRMIHRDAIQGAAASNLFVATTLVHMYARCGSLGEAFQVFEGMDRSKNVVAWNCIILGCVDRGEDELALEVYGRLFSGEQGHGTAVPNHVTFLAALKACTSLAKKNHRGKLALERNFPVPCEFLRRGREIHAWVARLDREVHIYVANALIDMYATCRSMVDASIVFERMEELSVVSWTEMILGFADARDEELALEFHSRMQHEEKEIASDRSVKMEALRRGRILHAQAARHAQEMHVFVANALVDLYSKCGCLLLARGVFEGMSSLDLVTWNSIILGYAEGGEGEKALELFARMREEERSRHSCQRESGEGGELVKKQSHTHSSYSINEP
ncbi:pentatricopeptide repeat-containing protein At4g18520, chloroplastic-like isoform X2 [Selaginella moellendorffii]|uniref:pentatricopeptide repeat-containing protein At4g18520, chloroplastic-like isoform X2 n=1 Tax=Selaginella moellendorffii TaxID=88036 RepID=UPI000D1CBC2E|nr:pentatricopeptide repeat-containing protein At4g18520, chloroplastic-like isoform X2 [Selaginella moellendorffii]|eukprot:XP_024520247.1 pentatricopeptide repeat-containing protein At4g18520, chloroplastic-like isoform X2 [Selaginella moellendorffii]